LLFVRCSLLGSEDREADGVFDAASLTARCGVPVTEDGTELVAGPRTLMPLAVLEADEETADGAPTADDGVYTYRKQKKY